MCAFPACEGLTKLMYTQPCFHSALEDNMEVLMSSISPSATLTVLVCPLLAAAYMSSTCWPDVVGGNFAASILQHWGRHSTLALKLGL